MLNNVASQTKSFLKDKDGKIVLFQFPNIPLCMWIVCSVISLFLDNGQAKTGFGLLGTASIFTWAYLEMTKGVTYLRQLLGFVVLVTIPVSFFR